ncbi:biopolymer transporter ExbD [Candidatus Babeliales bacterium]|nr:biopolymer transporter ExbD [Candidatus Babeliales bacterium]MCF7899435.1 biopolymer transporter ExbD [Candidatus Babeliales bacterium]
MPKKIRKKYSIKLPEITLTPLIDTALTLLVIFMVTAPMVQNGIKVDLPHGNSKEVGSQQELVVTISKDQKIFFNSYPIEKTDLIKSVQKAMNQREDIPVYVKADEVLAYGKVIEIVDELKQAGVKFVAMSTRAA